MCEASAISAGLMIAGNYERGQAEKQSADYRADVHVMNAWLARQAAVTEREAGTVMAGRYLSRGTQVASAQRAAYAGSGVDVSKGSPIDVIAGTAGTAALDAKTVKANAARRAWGYEVQAVEQEGEAQLERMKGKNAVTSSFLTGGAGAVSAFGNG